LYGICEINNRDYLFSLNLKKTKQDIHRLKKFKNHNAFLIFPWKIQLICIKGR